MMNIELWREIGDLIQRNEIIRAINLLEEKLSKSNGKRFMSLIGRDFDNDPVVVARGIEQFIIQSRKGFDINVVYLEMNGFDINPNLWFYDLFGYGIEEFDEEETDWLLDYAEVTASDSSETLTGLETV